DLDQAYFLGSVSPRKQRLRQRLDQVADLLRTQIQGRDAIYPCPRPALSPEPLEGVVEVVPVGDLFDPQPPPPAAQLPPPPRPPPARPPPRPLTPFLVMSLRRARPAAPAERECTTHGSPPAGRRGTDRAL